MADKITKKDQTKTAKGYWVKEGEQGLIHAMEYDAGRDNCTVSHHGSIFWDKKNEKWMIEEHERSFDGHYRGEAVYCDRDGIKEINKSAYNRILDAYGIRDGLLSLEEIANASPKELKTVSMILNRSIPKYKPQCKECPENEAEISDPVERALQWMKSSDEYELRDYGFKHVKSERCFKVNISGMNESIGYERMNNILAEAFQGTRRLELKTETSYDREREEESFVGEGTLSRIRTDTYTSTLVMHLEEGKPKFEVMKHQESEWDQWS
ncbi:MAG: hypothetical protein KKE20_00570 [Nanoarchaeota archaeon]|nr:hypothetical protein [Nanoarchaeota archaeon]